MFPLLDFGVMQARLLQGESEPTAMIEHIPEELRAEMAAAYRRQQRRRTRMRVKSDGKTYPVLRMWRDGFAVPADGAEQLRGLVDIHDGDRHLYRCLIVACDEDGDEISYEFKRMTAAVDHAPLDFAREADPDVPLLPR